jgi:methylglutaconyl-CoA hydratase
MTMTASIQLSVDTRGVALLTLNREECHNAIDRDCANLLIANLQTLDEDEAIRVVVLTGNGINFSAGHDMVATRGMADAPLATLQQDCREVAQLLSTLDTLSKPTIARVQGSAFGLGVGLIACCDFAFGASDALFGFSEVRQGVIAGITSAYVTRAIGARAARRYLLSSERFNAAKAKRLGLLHQDVPLAELDACVEQCILQLLLNGPQAMTHIKRLVSLLEHHPIDAELLEQLIEHTAAVRASEEGREGMAAFIEHRKPGWAP